MVKNRTGLSKRSEESFLHVHKQCHTYCLRDKRYAASILESVKQGMIKCVSPNDREKGWRIYLRCFPPIANRTRRLILEKRLKFVSKLPIVGNVYRVSSVDNQTYTVYSDSFQCDCRYFKLLCESKKEVTCEHVLACVIADACKLVQKPENDRVREYLGLPAKNENLPELKFGPYESDHEFPPDESSGSDADSTSEDSDFDNKNCHQGPLTIEEQNVEYSFKD